MSYTGTHTLEDLKSIKDKTAVAFGLDAVQDVVTADLAAHNAVLADQMAAYAAPTTMREAADGTGNLLQGVMELADEFSRVRTQKDGKPGKVGFPLHKRQYAIGFTADYLREAPLADVATRILGAQRAHIQAHLTDMKKALFLPTNRTFSDYLVDDMDLSIKALYNGDGTIPALGPNAEEFGGSHSHYLGSATLTTAALDALILTVAEHNGNADVRLHINVAQESVVRGLAGFIPAVDPRVNLGANAAVAVSPLALGNRGNRVIGYYNGAEVHIKPWVPASYVAAVDVNAPARALAMRQPVDPGQQGLRQVALIVTYPLQAQYWESKFAYGVKSRGAAAVLFIGNATYAAPSGL